MFELCTASGDNCYIREVNDIQLGPRDSDPAAFQALLEELAALYLTPEPMKVKTLPLWLSMVNPDPANPIYDSLEWDPNVQVLFGDFASAPVGNPEEAVTNTATAIAAGVSVGVIAAVVIILLVVVWKVPRLRAVFMPVSDYSKSKSIRKSKMQEVLEKEAQTDAEVAARARARTDAAVNPAISIASDSHSSGSPAASTENKRWTIIQKPLDVRNTIEV
jgi:hypothetical protein